MSLYLCIFEDDDELEGVAVGAYSDFGFFRDTVAKALEAGKWGSRFPTLMSHSDCDGEWGVADCEKLASELETITEEMKKLPPVSFPAEWQRKLAKTHGLQPQNLADCFIDVDGEPLLARLRELVNLSTTRKLPILFQ